MPSLLFWVQWEGAVWANYVCVCGGMRQENPDELGS